MEQFYKVGVEESMFVYKTHVNWFLMPLFLFCGFFIFVGYGVYQDADKAAYESCIYSVKPALIKTIIDNKAISEAISPGQEWRTLNKKEVDLLLTTFGNFKGYDCGNYPSSKTGENVQIAIRLIKGKLEMSLQINGRVDTTLQEIK